MRWLWYSFLALVSLGMLGIIGAVGGAVVVISYFGRDLPDYRALKDYEPPVVTRIYAGDGRLVEEYATERRVFVPIDSIPDVVKYAFISAEDKNFFEHHGIDYFAIARAALTNLRTGSTQGASTITQQVAKNFLLSNEKTYERKIREAILAFRMERALSKERLLELYLNEIYLGERAYGVGAAALYYFNKSLEELTIYEAAYLAALPKAPNNYHPVRHREAAIGRRNWVVDRMQEDGYISEGQAGLAKAAPLEMKRRTIEEIVEAPHFAEEVRRRLITRYGDNILYQGGLAVRTSLDPRLQEIAQRTLRNGLVEYDRRHGWRGPLAHWDSIDGWKEKLASFEAPSSMPADWKVAIVLGADDGKATIGLADGSQDVILKEHLTWARKQLANKGLGPEVTSARQVLKAGDVVMTTQVTVDGKKVYGLRQIPEVNGALVAMDPHTGRVLALQGGWSHSDSEFNRATQAWRQPGSAFKPFVYLTALQKGFTPATLVLDAPIVIDQGPGLKKWRPENYSREYYGPTPIRVGIEKSRNLMTVRLADYVGMPEIIKTSKNFGVVDHMPPHLANALGAGETTLLRLTTGYAQFVNGGHKITPTLIDRIQDRRGQTVFSHDDRPCVGCGRLIEWNGQDAPPVPDMREQIADPRHAYQIVSILEGVVERGTGTRIKALGRPLAGKTGTTNESRDAWFIGFSPDLVVGVYIGFDEPRSLGRKETGSSVAVPVFKDFMEEALAGTPPTPFRIPPGIRQVQINAETGARAQAGDKNVIWEAFVTGTEPTDKMYILDANGISLLRSYPSYSINVHTAPEEIRDEIRIESLTTGTGGLY